MIKQEQCNFLQQEQKFLNSKLDNYDEAIKELADQGNYNPSDPDDYYKLQKLARGSMIT